MCRTPSRPPRKRLGDHRIHALCAIGESAHQHGQIDAGDDFHTPGRHELAREVARGRAVDVRKDEHAVARVELAYPFAGVGQKVERIVGGRHRQRLELRRSHAEHVRDGASQAIGQRIVRDDENADHPAILARKEAGGYSLPAERPPEGTKRALRHARRGQQRPACRARAAPRTATRPRPPRRSAPSFITSTRCDIARTTARSWLMKT